LACWRPAGLWRGLRTQDSLEVHFQDDPRSQAGFELETGILYQRLENITRGGNSIMPGAPFPEVNQETADALRILMVIAKSAAIQRPSDEVFPPGIRGMVAHAFGRGLWSFRLRLFTHYARIVR